MVIVQRLTSKLVIMAKYFKVIIALSLLLITACEEGGEAGDLYGQWKMKGSDTKFIAFSGSVTVLRSTNNNKLENQVFGNFQHTGDSLFIQCYSVEGKASDTLTVENGYGFKPFTNIRLKIRSIDGDNLILTKDDKVWSFEKY